MASSSALILQSGFELPGSWRIGTPHRASSNKEAHDWIGFSNFHKDAVSQLSQCWFYHFQRTYMVINQTGDMTNSFLSEKNNHVGQRDLKTREKEQLQLTDQLRSHSMSCAHKVITLDGRRRKIILWLWVIQWLPSRRFQPMQRGGNSPWKPLTMNKQDDAKRARVLLTPQASDTPQIGRSRWMFDPSEIERNSFVWSASDAPSVTRAWVSQRRNVSNLLRPSESSTNQIIFHELPNNVGSFKN